MSEKYSIGVDYETLFAQVVLVDLSNGDVVASSVMEYPDAVIEAH